MKHELYGAAQPYAHDDALPSELAKVDHAQIAAHYRKFFVPTNAVLILVGDVDPQTATDLANRNFGNWAGGAVPKLDFGDLKPPPDKTRVIIAHRPKSAQSDVFVALQAPPRQSKEWAKVRVAEQILGGGVGGRLFLDVREQRSLAYHVSATVSDHAHGKQPMLLYAGTQTPKTADAVTGLLENLERMKSSPPTEAETASARRYLSDIFAIYMENLGAIGSLVGARKRRSGSRRRTSTTTAKSCVRPRKRRRPTKPRRCSETRRSTRSSSSRATQTSSAATSRSSARSRSSIRRRTST